jgi:GDP-4-dehydro-6-deoxy-D-mannose reductase
VEGIRAWVTGASGFIAGYLIPLLENEEREVLASDVAAEPDGWFGRPPSLGWRRCDVTNPEEVGQSVREADPDIIFHLAAISLPAVSWSDPRSTLTVNVLGTVNVLEAVRHLTKVPRVFLACSSAEYGLSARTGTPISEDAALAPLHPYGVSKVAEDLLGLQYHHNYGIPTIRGRIFNTIGPGKMHDAPGDFATQIARVEAGLETEVHVGNLTSARDFTDVRDMARAIVQITNSGQPGEVYNLCSARAVPLRTVLDLLLVRTSVPVPWVVDPARARTADEPIIVGDNRRLVKATHWAPKLELKTTLSDTLDYWRGQPPKELT